MPDIVTNGESPGTRILDAAMGRIEIHPICKRLSFTALFVAVDIGIARSSQRLLVTNTPAADA